MEYGYEKKDHRGNLVYPMHPVQEEDADVEIDLLIQNINIRVRPTSDIQDIIEIYRLKSK